MCWGPYTYRWVMKFPKEVRLRQQCGAGVRLKRVYIHAILNEGERPFQITVDIYIYIYIWKVDKGVAEIKFCYPMFACEGKRQSM